jgi:hypothetical protein
MNHLNYYFFLFILFFQFYVINCFNSPVLEKTLIRERVTNPNWNERIRNFKEEKKDVKRNDKESFWDRARARFISWKPKFISKTNYDESVSESSLRYHLRLKSFDDYNRRHVTTRIRRFLPQISYELADSIAERALENGVALVCYLSNQVQ